MSNSGNWGEGCATINVLTMLEAIRKRPGMYLGRSGGPWRSNAPEDPLLAAKLVKQAFIYATEATYGSVEVGPKGSAKVSYNMALPVTGERGGRYISEGSPAPGPAMLWVDDEIVGDLTAVVALSSQFDALVDDGSAVWGQRFENGVAVTPYEVVDETALVRSCTFEFQLDATILPNVDIDFRYLMMWAGDQSFPIKVIS